VPRRAPTSKLPGVTSTFDGNYSTQSNRPALPASGASSSRPQRTALDAERGGLFSVDQVTLDAEARSSLRTSLHNNSYVPLRVPRRYAAPATGPPVPGAYDGHRTTPAHSLTTYPGPAPPAASGATAPRSCPVAKKNQGSVKAIGPAKQKEDRDSSAACCC